MDVRKTVLVGHSAEEMFDVIESAERYPEFLPWCAGATIVARSDSEVVADIEVDFHGVRFGFRTRNRSSSSAGRSANSAAPGT
jgi:ribosome-associated toxin RatA of RatAB toxin-antitoxin module